MNVRHPVPTCSDVPRELDKSTIPAYRVEPPDILLIEVVLDLKPADALLRPGDQLLLRGSNLLPIDPEDDPNTAAQKVISGAYSIEASGEVDLGPDYGRVEVAGLSTSEAYTAIKRHLVEEVELKDPRIAVSLGTPNAPQPIAGEHLVTPDGTVNLGLYGSVHVAGLTVEEVRSKIVEHLGRYIQDPLVRVSVLGFNSMKVYVILDGGGFGERVVQLPYTGTDTVLDAIAQVQGLSDVSSKKLWVARPAPAGTGVAQTLPVDWCAITQGGLTATNYQLFPGDRIYVKADRLISLDNFIGKVLSPVERVFGTVILGTGLVNQIQNGGNFNNNNSGNNIIAF